MADNYQEAVEEVRLGLATNTAYATAVRLQHLHKVDANKLMADAVAKNKAVQDPTGKQQRQQPQPTQELVELQSAEQIEAELAKAIQAQLGGEALPPDLYAVVYCLARQQVKQRNWILALMGYEVND